MTYQRLPRQSKTVRRLPKQLRKQQLQRVVKMTNTGQRYKEYEVVESHNCRYSTSKTKLYEKRFIHSKNYATLSFRLA